MTEGGRVSARPPFWYHDGSRFQPAGFQRMRPVWRYWAMVSGGQPSSARTASVPVRNTASASVISRSPNHRKRNAAEPDPDPVLTRFPYPRSNNAGQPCGDPFPPWRTALLRHGIPSTGQGSSPPDDAPGKTPHYTPAAPSDCASAESPAPSRAPAPPPAPSWCHTPDPPADTPPRSRQSDPPPGYSPPPSPP